MTSVVSSRPQVHSSQLGSYPTNVRPDIDTVDDSVESSFPSFSNRRLNVKDQLPSNACNYESRPIYRSNITTELTVVSNSSNCHSSSVNSRSAAEDMAGSNKSSSAISKPMIGRVRSDISVGGNNNSGAGSVSSRTSRSVTIQRYSTLPNSQMHHTMTASQPLSFPSRQLYSSQGEGYKPLGRSIPMTVGGVARKPSASYANGMTYTSSSPQYVGASTLGAYQPEARSVGYPSATPIYSHLPAARISSAYPTRQIPSTTTLGGPNAPLQPFTNSSIITRSISVPSGPKRDIQQRGSKSKTSSSSSSYTKTSSSTPQIRGFSFSESSTEQSEGMSTCSSTAWDIKSRYLTAMRTGPTSWPDHILALHPEFSSETPSPFVLYYYDETAPNEVLLANDVKGEHPCTIARKNWKAFWTCQGTRKEEYQVAGDEYTNMGDRGLSYSSSDQESSSKSSAAGSSITDYTHASSYFTRSAFTSVAPDTMCNVGAGKRQASGPNKSKGAGCCGGGRRSSSSTSEGGSSASTAPSSRAPSFGDDNKFMRGRSRSASGLMPSYGNEQRRYSGMAVGPRGTTYFGSNDVRQPSRQITGGSGAKRSVTNGSRYISDIGYDNNNVGNRYGCCANDQYGIPQGHYKAPAGDRSVASYSTRGKDARYSRSKAVPYKTCAPTMCAPRNITEMTGASETLPPVYPRNVPARKATDDTIKSRGTSRGVKKGYLDQIDDDSTSSSYTTTPSVERSKRSISPSKRSGGCCRRRGTEETSYTSTNSPSKSRSKSREYATKSQSRMVSSRGVSSRAVSSKGSHTDRTPKSLRKESSLLSEDGIETGCCGTRKREEQKKSYCRKTSVQSPRQMSSHTSLTPRHTSTSYSESSSFRTEKTSSFQKKGTRHGTSSAGDDEVSFMAGGMTTMSDLSSLGSVYRYKPATTKEANRDYGYHVRKQFFDAESRKVAEKGSEFKMLPQVSTSYRNYPTICYDVITPTTYPDYFRARKAPTFCS